MKTETIISAVHIEGKTIETMVDEIVINESTDIERLGKFLQGYNMKTSGTPNHNPSKFYQQSIRIRIQTITTLPNCTIHKEKLYYFEEGEHQRGNYFFKDGVLNLKLTEVR